MIRLAVIVVLLSGVRVWTADQSYPLESVAGLRLHNVTAAPETLHGKKGVRVTASEAAETLAVVEGLEFGNGVIKAEIAGAVQPGAPEGARGFVGIAFRLQGDMKTYDAFYLRPTNGRADDQVRRNHSAQYISHPDWTWSRLRTETPSKYESYVDLVPGEWTKVRIEVNGGQARLYVHGQPQPTLVVNDVKTGPDAKGSVALWVDVGTLAHFRNLTVTRALDPPGRQ
jgi:3-keto-disaccharide hydrolase